MPDATPVLALTIGDPAGIGPEIVARTLADPPEGVDARGVAVGDAEVVRRAVQVCGLDVEVVPVPGIADARCAPGTIDVVDIGVVGSELAWGEVSPVAGRAAVTAIEVATRAAMDAEVAGIVTAPINKEAIWAAGSAHLGHTEMLGQLTGSARFNTMFVVRGLKIFFTTRHASLRTALDGVTRQTVGTAIEESWTALKVLGHDQPRLAVAALNPHGGEGGSFGDEEISEIGPACDDARAAGKGVVGPVPADAVFHHGLQGRYDAVLAHFHDQGHIAAKTVDFEGAITVTMGLPILRTSVDHGTAFDIAGSGQASHRGMAAAFAAAARYAPFVGAMRAEYGA
ncbi:MAG: 4-hydroxythreonine-4-phosphate dehydrogenase PdxA [Egibacteraceae bacterium]|jgi:4-hydroxythreonine-4-phosphate dehydrogenase